MFIYLFRFAMSLAWSFFWRFCLLFPAFVFIQLRFFSTDTLLFFGYSFFYAILISLLSFFTCFLPFVLSFYWMIARGVMNKKTKKYYELMDRASKKKINIAR